MAFFVHLMPLICNAAFFIMSDRWDVIIPRAGIGYLTAL